MTELTHLSGRGRKDYPHIITELSGVVATKGRASILERTLQSLGEQSAQPARLIVVDASADRHTRDVCERGATGLHSEIVWTQSKSAGAATQRSEGVRLAEEEIIWFFDDDISLQADCVARLWEGLHKENQIGGVNAMIVNQRYQPPGSVSRLMFLLMNGGTERSFAGKLIGPAINLLPEDRDDLPNVVTVEWLNTTCTMYRREALPSPPFDPFFVGYSLMEDVALSRRVVERGWKLANVRTARIFHDSQPGGHKDDPMAMATMELINRHYVMTKILKRRSMVDYLKLLLWEMFQLSVTAARSETRRLIWPALKGKIRAAKQISLNG
jgi:GT2 family glycosyltransferase